MLAQSKECPTTPINIISHLSTQKIASCSLRRFRHIRQKNCINKLEDPQQNFYQKQKSQFSKHTPNKLCKLISFYQIVLSSTLNFSGFFFCPGDILRLFSKLEQIIAALKRQLTFDSSLTQMSFLKFNYMFVITSWKDNTPWTFCMGHETPQA